jgi:hypothetical protein
LAYTWARTGQQPLVPPCGKRKAYKVFGLIDYLTGRCCFHGQTERFTAASYTAFQAHPAQVKQAMGTTLETIGDQAA